MASSFYIKQTDGTWAAAKLPASPPPTITVGNGTPNFFDMLKTKATSFIYGLDLTGVTSLNSAFYGASAMTAAPNLDTSNVTYMGGMFSGCSALTTIPTYNTSKVTSFSSMFQSCSGLTSVPLLDTSKATTVGNMFAGTTKLASIPAFNFGSVTNADSIFNNSGITSLPDLDFHSVTTMNASSYPWFGSANTVLATIGKLNLSGTSTLASFFAGMSGLQSISGLTTSALLTNISNLFSGCSKLTAVPAFITSAVTNAAGAFQNCSALTSVADLNLSKVTTMATMFLSCASLVTAPNITASPSLVSTSNMFGGCSKLSTVTAFDTSGVTNASSMFQNCAALATVPAFNFGAVTAGNLNNTFAGCTSLSSIQATGFKVSFSIANCALGASALNTLFSNLATVTGQTITITGNPGAATCDKTIATSKGWTVTA